jgi:tetratricopeptide (TPR) repeat protein
LLISIPFVWTELAESPAITGIQSALRNLPLDHGTEEQKEVELVRGLKALPPSHENVLRVVKGMERLANYYEIAGREVDAQLVYARALELAQKENHDGEVSNIELKLGGSYMRTARFDDALRVLKDSSKYEADQNRVAVAQNMCMAHVYFMTRRYLHAARLTLPTVAALDARTSTEVVSEFYREAIDSLCSLGNYKRSESLIERVGPAIAPPEYKRVQQAEIKSALARDGSQDKLFDGLQAELEPRHDFVTARFYLAIARKHRRKGDVMKARTAYATAMEEVIRMAARESDLREICRLQLIKLQIATEFIDYSRQYYPTGVMDLTMRLNELNADLMQMVEKLNDQSKVPKYLKNHEFLP